MSVKEQFIENVKEGKVLTHKCTSCGLLHLSNVIIVKNVVVTYLKMLF